MPNPGVAGQAVTLFAVAGDVNGDGLAYTWNFGDGTFGTGPVVNHTYSAAGVYTALVTVSDGTSTVTGSVDVAINAAASSGTLHIQKAALKFAFSGGTKDSLQFAGTLSGVTSAKTVTLQIGSLKKTFSATDKSSKFALKNGKFSLSVKNTPLFSALEEFGFTNGTVGKPGNIVTIDVILTLDDVSFIDSVTVLYTAKSGSGGQAKK
jgi:PKD repeat protein